MKRSIFILAAVCFTAIASLSAQEKYDDLVKVGDELIIGSPAKAEYEFIEVPRKNFIIKRGGIANIRSLYKNKVVVDKIVYDKQNNATAVLKRSNGTKFFNACRTLRADLNGAIQNGELQLKNATKKTGEIAK